MQLAEFKAWFEGYTEDMDGAPSKKQWAKIQEKIAEIDGQPVRREVIERHYRDYLPYCPRQYDIRPRVTYGTSDSAGIRDFRPDLIAMGRADAAMLSTANAA